jgi:hypothetical protein
MAEHGAEQMRPAPTPARFRDPRPQAEVDLHLSPGLALHPAEWQLVDDAESPDVTLDRLVASGEPVLADQILIDPLGRQPSVQTGRDLGGKRHTKTGRPRRRAVGRVTGCI